MSDSAPQAAVPSVDRILRLRAVAALIEVYGRSLVTEATRSVLAELRDELVRRGENALPMADEGAVVTALGERLSRISRPSLRPVFNLTGTVLHTNLGRAPLPEAALAAVVEIARGASNLEYDLDHGGRGDRDAHVEALVCRLAGAEAVTVVNNNAAAVLLVLNTLALRREVVVSRGELIEIGGTFRMPDIMARAGCKLVEVGTTNRTHPRDFADAIGRRSAALMKVHTSNYVIRGFTAAVPDNTMAGIAHAHGLPLIVDLGSGSLIDLRRYDLPYEPTVSETLEAGADIVTFSGDKLLGGPQAGIIAGRKDFVAKIKRNPMKRALRPDKMTTAALAAVLRLYSDPDRLAENLPTIRLCARPAEEVRAMARRILPLLEGRVAAVANVEVVPCESQIGSGALPAASLPSFALALRPRVGRRGSGRALKRINAAFRNLSVPVLGRVEDGALLFDLRCLEDEQAFISQLDSLALDQDGAVS